MKPFKLFFPVLMLFSLTAIYSCEKESATAGLSDIESFEAMEDESFADELSFGSEEIGHLPMAFHLFKDKCSRDWKSRLPACARVEVSGQAYPKNIRIHFSDSCESPRGRKLAGFILIEISDDLKKPGAKRVMTLKDFSINGRSISGKRILVNKGTNKEGNFVFESKNRIKVEGRNGTHIREDDRIVEWLEGFGNDNCEDNVWRIKGRSTASDETGNHRDMLITIPLLKDFNCRHFTKGEIQRKKGDKVSLINFGDGLCDNTATLTRDGITTEIDLNKHKERRYKRKCHQKGKLNNE